MKYKFGMAFLLAMLGVSTANANENTNTEHKSTIIADKEKQVSEIDNILGELSRQHTNASELVKVVREPVSFSANHSNLLANTPTPSKKDTNILAKMSDTASNSLNRFVQSGFASWYGRQFHGKKTASGERFDMNALTAAHRSLPFGCYVKVTNKDNGQSVIVRINDRGPFHGNRVVDLSYGAAKAIGITKKGMGNVVIERVDDPKTQLTLNNNQ